MTHPAPQSPALPGGPELRRREFLQLAAAGALGLGASGCPAPASAPPRAIGGALHGQDAALGHMLRSGELLERGVDAHETADTLVVGGGVAGLACAWRLRRAGHSTVRVVDMGHAPGGNARSGENEVSRYPWGAHYLRVPTAEHRALATFCDEVGLIRHRDAAGQPDWDTRAICSAPTERVFEGGLWRSGLYPPPRSEVDADVAALEQFEALVDALSQRRGSDGKAAFALPMAASSQDPDLLALDAISFGQWLDEQEITQPALRWYLEYACRDDYGCTLETTSAWAGLHYFCSRDYDREDQDLTLTWPEGNGRLVQLLLEAAGGQDVTTRALCFRMQPGADASAPSSADLYLPESDRVVRVSAQHLVYAGSRYLLGRLLDTPPPGVDDFTYSPWLVANVTLDRPPGGVGAQLAWDNVFYKSASLGYVVANRSAGRDDPCVITWYRPFTQADVRAARQELFELDHAAIVGLVAGELLAAHPTLRGAIRSVDAWRWGHAMIRPVPGFMWGPARRAAEQPGGALICANSDVSGLPLFEEAFYRGVVAGEAILGRAGEFESIL